jgi:RNA polymerase sigma factor (sigma-70 family)
MPSAGAGLTAQREHDRPTVCEADHTLGVRRFGSPRTLIVVPAAVDEVDAELLARMAHDDAAAFGMLYDRHVQRVYAHCVGQLGTAQDADDLTAVVFLEAWRHRTGIRIVSGSALPWLLLTATNVARNHKRAMRRYRGALSRIPAPEVIHDHAEDVAQRHATAPAVTALADALSKLNASDREVISLCLLGGLSYQETAEILGLSHAAVRSRLLRARRSIRASLEAAGITGMQEVEDD